jgi:hypothetical protein
MYFPTLNVNAHNFKSLSYCLSMVMKHISILCITIWTRVVGHDGEKWCYGIPIPKLLKNIITILHKLQDNIVAKSSIVKKRFQNLFQVNSFSLKIIFCWLHINSILITTNCKSVSWLFLEITTYLFYDSNLSSIMSMNSDPHKCHGKVGSFFLTNQLWHMVIHIRTMSTLTQNFPQSTQNWLFHQSCVYNIYIYCSIFFLNFIINGAPMFTI